MSEATTRTLEEADRLQPMTEPINAGPTVPAYVAPSPFPPAPVPSTNQLPGRHKWLIMLLAGLVLLMMIVVGGLLFFIGSQDGRLVGVPGIEAPPPPPPPPTDPPPPPAPPTLGGGSFLEIKDLSYPGAKKDMDITSGSGKGVVQLQTPDSAQKVVEWYKAKLRPTEHLNLPGGNAILKAGDVSVVITAGDGVTSIFIAKGDD